MRSTIDASQDLVIRKLGTQMNQNHAENRGAFEEIHATHEKQDERIERIETKVDLILEFIQAAEEREAKRRRRVYASFDI